MTMLPNGHIFSGSGDDKVRVWDSVTGQCIKLLTGHTGVSDECRVLIFILNQHLNCALYAL